MKITEIELIDRVLVLGAPGVGKTELIMSKAKEEAEKLGKIFIDLRDADNTTINDILSNPRKYYVYIRIVAPHIFPEDIGIPRERDGYVEFLPPKALKILTLPDIYGLVFIDEITNVQRDDQISMYYSLILEKEAGFQLKLSRNIKIVLAGNTPEWSEIVRPLPKPLRNRMIVINVSPPTVDEWIEYMNRRYGDNWEKLVAVYLETNPDDFLKQPNNDDFENFPTPRSWTQLALTLKNVKNKELAESVIYGSIGKEVGDKFIAMYFANIDISSALETIRHDPSSFDEYNISAQSLIINALSQQQITVLKAKYSKFIEYLLDKHREFLVIMILLMNANKRSEFKKTFPEIARKLVDAIAEYMSV